MGDLARLHLHADYLGRQARGSLAAELRAVLDEVERRRQLDQAIDKLIVATHDDDVDVLVVDAQALMCCDKDVRSWTLHEVEPGLWRHWPSDTKGPLGHILRAIAYTHTAPRPHHESEAR